MGDGNACTLLSDFGKVVQVALGAMSFSVLLYKRKRETPQRPWNIFLMDTSKQAFSAGVAHLVGMFVATVMHEYMANESECAWYIVVFVVDTTLGMGVALSLLAVSQRIATRAAWTWVAATGEYGQNEGDGQVYCRRWAAQMLVWVFVTFMGRLASALFVFVTRRPLSHVADAIAYPFIGHPNVFLVVVMLGGPLVLNILQLWVQDERLKRKKRSMIVEVATTVDDVEEGGEGEESLAPLLATAAISVSSAPDAARTSGREAYFSLGTPSPEGFGLPPTTAAHEGGGSGPGLL